MLKHLEVDFQEPIPLVIYTFVICEPIKNMSTISKAQKQSSEILKNLYRSRSISFF